MTQDARADWSVLLGQMVIAKQAIAERAPGRGEPYAPPRPGATEAQLATFETGIGQRPPRAFRGFLSYANGWPDFHDGMDLFGLPELTDDRRLPPARRDVDPLAALAVGADADARRLVLVTRLGRRDAGRVRWFDGERSRCFEDFAEFFAHLTRGKRDEANRLPPP